MPTKASEVMKVGTATDPAKLAGAVFKYLEEGCDVSARALGINANYQLCKAIHLVHEFFRKHGREVYVQMSTATEPVPGDKDGRTIRSFTATFTLLEDLR